ncbi:hypothetical protein EAG_11735 [Camponotus floridanus]|uniref:Uncharacterized protein n=1 Tax=Camponotus floridanus TaxID=104421 RepID=E2AYG4_CAMFO|nr:hypothetical protein EAG_11735 [Camponotus floridanus]
MYISGSYKWKIQPLLLNNLSAISDIRKYLSTMNVVMQVSGLTLFTGEDENSESARIRVDRTRNWQQATMRGATSADCAEVARDDSGPASGAYRIILFDKSVIVFASECYKEAAKRKEQTRREIGPQRSNYLVVIKTAAVYLLALFLSPLEIYSRIHRTPPQALLEYFELRDCYKLQVEIKIKHEVSMYIIFPNRNGKAPQANTDDSPRPTNGTPAETAANMILHDKMHTRKARGESTHTEFQELRCGKNILTSRYVISFSSFKIAQFGHRALFRGTVNYIVVQQTYQSPLGILIHFLGTVLVPLSNLPPLRNYDCYRNPTPILRYIESKVRRNAVWKSKEHTHGRIQRMRRSGSIRFIKEPTYRRHVNLASADCTESVRHYAS